MLLRYDELRFAKWTEVDLDGALRTVPSVRTKRATPMRTTVVTEGELIAVNADRRQGIPRPPPTNATAVPSPDDAAARFSIRSNQSNLQGQTAKRDPALTTST